MRPRTRIIERFWTFILIFGLFAKEISAQEPAQGCDAAKTTASETKLEAIKQVDADILAGKLSRAEQQKKHDEIKLQYDRIAARLALSANCAIVIRDWCVAMA